MDSGFSISVCDMVYFYIHLCKMSWCFSFF